MEFVERRVVYVCDIIYFNNLEFGFDYFCDNISDKEEDFVMWWFKLFNFVIVDEVDFVLIDEGCNLLLISIQFSKDVGCYLVVVEVVVLFILDFYYKVNIKEKSLDLIEEGVVVVEFVFDI